MLKKEIMTQPGEIIDFMTYYAQEEHMTGVPTHVGTVEKLVYETSVYEDGRTYEKYCNVYLPYGYDPEDQEKKYNVVYYQHGNTWDPELINQAEYRRKMDCLFELPGIEPCIVVYTTYYFDVLEDVKTRKTTGQVPAGDGMDTDHKPMFYKEVIEDIIPAVELKYHTYLTDRSEEARKASRDHRAFCGYSRGSVCTWYMLHNAFEYFRWYMPMSCRTFAGRQMSEPLTEEMVLNYLEAPIKAHPELPFYVYASNGGKLDLQNYTEQMKFICRSPYFSYGQDPAVNHLFFAVSDMHHDDVLSPFYLANSLKVAFR